MHVNASAEVKLQQIPYFDHINCYSLHGPTPQN